VLTIRASLGRTGFHSSSLNGVSVTVDGLPAPILALANVNGAEQVNFQVPFEIAGLAAASVTVARDGAASTAAGVPVLELQPAVYTSDGVRAIVVHAADYTLVTEERPLVAGEFAFVYATGLGPVANQPATGSGGPISPLATVLAGPQVSLAGLNCDVPFAGLAPTLVGVYQVNFRVPLGAPAAARVGLAAGGASAPTVRCR
jgi:uncharacterized protein (TIGR03437 family)